MKKWLWITGMFCLGYAQAQDTLRLPLTQALHRAASESVDAVTVRNQYRVSYWEYRTYRAELLPEVSFSGTVPYYSKSYNSFQNADGTYTFVSNDYSRIDAGLYVTQNIPWTGGKLSLESSFQRLQQYGNNSNTRYMGLPGAVTLEQPVLGYNKIKWQQRIEPVRYREAQLRLAANIEEVSVSALTHYFNLLIGVVNQEIAVQNLKNAKKLYTIAQARRNIGQISENELLQLQVSLLNAEGDLTDALSSYRSRMFQLRSFLGYDEQIVIEPVLPDLPETVPRLDYWKVLLLAEENSPFTHNIRRRMLEAASNVAQARADRWNVSLFVSFGMSGQENTFSRAFSQHHLRNNQVVNVGLKIPLLDWGKGKGKVHIAQANQEVIASQLDKETLDFRQDLFIMVENFNNQSEQLRIAAEKDRIASLRYETSVEAFILGKIEVLNLNDAQTSKDQARRNYIEQMFLLWSYYYQIRALTLHDFFTDQPITVDYERLL